MQEKVARNEVEELGRADPEGAEMLFPGSEAPRRYKPRKACSDPLLGEETLRLMWASNSDSWVTSSLTERRAPVWSSHGSLACTGGLITHRPMPPSSDPRR